MEQYFTNNPNLKSNFREIKYKYLDKEFIFTTDNGVFSKSEIDYGSICLIKAFLSKHSKLDDTTTMLDVGCGYGSIGIILSKVLDVTVDLIDINKRAIHLCKMNIDKNKVKGNAYESNCYENIVSKYDYIITNPPIRAGNSVVLNILTNAKEHLKENGELWFVINKNQGAKSIEKKLLNDYKIEIISKNKGFYCFCAINA